MSVSRNPLIQFYNTLLKVNDFQDYGPNGLQIEGTHEIKKIAFAVSATVESISQAVDFQADALVVHHGLFWSFHGAQPLTGPFAKRIFPLVNNQINLLGYHLPLDAHLTMGNAAEIGKHLHLQNIEPFGNYKGCPTGIQGQLSSQLTAQQLADRLALLLNHPVILASANKTSFIDSIGIITGGANSDWKLASEQGLDGYITGEISEHDWHESQESGIHMFAGGHHATEQFGIQALLKKTQAEFDVECVFFNSQNPA